MRYFVLTKHSIFIAFCLMCSCLLILGGVSEQWAAVETAKTNQKLLPVYSVDTKEPKIAITLDAAWGAEDTDVLLHIFEEYDAKVTIFAVGDFVRKNPDAIQKFYKAGHQIANHSDRHTLYTKLSQKEIQQDMEKCNAEIARVIGETPKYVRAPSGAYTDSAIKASKIAGMQMVQWSVDSLDWQGLSVEEMVKRVTSATQNGSILLFHNDVKNTPQALREILKELKGRGFSFVTVDELLYKEPFSMDYAGKQHPLSEKVKENTTK